MNPFSEETFRGHLNTISQNRQRYDSGFRPGTQTLDRDKYDEGTRQFDLSLKDAQQARKESALQAALDRQERTRQFDLSHDLARRETEYNVGKPYYNPTTGGSSGSSGGGSSKGNSELFADAIDSMLDGQARHRQAVLGGQTRNPHSYNYYVNQAIGLANETGMPLSNAEIKDLMTKAADLSAADLRWKENL